MNTLCIVCQCPHNYAVGRGIYSLKLVGNLNKKTEIKYMEKPGISHEKDYVKINLFFIQRGGILSLT